MLKAYSWLTFSIVMWGSNFIFGKILLMHFSPAWITMLRLLFIVLFLIGLAVYKKHLQPIIHKQDLLAILFLGVVGVFINQLSFFQGLVTADPTASALVIATAPIVTGVLAAIFLKEKLTLRMLFGSIIAIVGIFFVATKGTFSAVQIDKGLFWIVITMITFSIMIILTRVLSKRMEALSITLYSNIVGFVISIPFAFILDRPLKITTDISAWLFLMGTAIAVHGIATYVWNSNIRYVEASKSSILSNLEPFVTMVVGFILLAKPVTWIEIAGSFLIVGGVLLSTYTKSPQKTVDENI